MLSAIKKNFDFPDVQTMIAGSLVEVLILKAGNWLSLSNSPSSSIKL
jgi:hypothetical protein